MDKSRTGENVLSADRVGGRRARNRGLSRGPSSEVVGRAHRAWEDTSLPNGELDCVIEVLTREQTYRRYLAIADGVATLLSVVATAAVTRTHLTWFVIAAPAVVVMGAKVQGLYDRDDLVIRKSTWTELPVLLTLAGVATLIGYAARGQLLGTQSSRAGFFLVLWLSLVTCMLGGRTIARRVARWRAPDERCVIVGDETYCSGLAEGIAHIDGVTLVGTVPLAELAGSAEALHALASRLAAHRLIIAFDRQLSDVATLELVRLAKAIGLRVSLLPSVMAAVGGSVVVDQLGGYTLLGVPRFGLSKSSAAVKRSADVVGSLLAIVLLAPLMLTAALLIRLDTRGPVFFLQTRVGRRGSQFDMLKFRSMVDGADSLKPALSGSNEAGHGMFKIAADPRITAVGRSLRRTKIDELPQLFNVLAGKMSLVGPRPLVVEEDEQIRGMDRRRLHLTPGMTGPWQILGSSAVPINEMAKLDYLYIANWSVWEDLRILGQTLFLVAQGRGT